MMSYIDLVFITKCLVALTIGFILGFEREYRAKPAGVKTYAMICLGAAIFTHVSTSISGYADPSRVAAQIVSGLGFIGAGAIFQSKRMITGLTTAATLWVSGSLGVLVGLELYVEAVVALIFIYMYFLGTRLIQFNKLRHFKYTTNIQCESQENLKDLEKLLQQFNLDVISKRVDKLDSFQLSITYLCREKVNREFVNTLITISWIKKITH